MRQIKQWEFIEMNVKKIYSIDRRYLGQSRGSDLTDVLYLQSVVLCGEIVTIVLVSKTYSKVHVIILYQILSESDW